MISETDKKIILEYTQKYNLSSVILFGSSLHSQHFKDIDIGIKGIKPESFFDFYWDIYSRLSKPVDIINLGKKSKFNRLVEEDGYILYDKTNKIHAEIDNISIVLKELEKIADKPEKSVTELAGIGTFLHNFYSGIENIIKQIITSKNISIPDSHTWHKELLDKAVRCKVITENTKSKLGKFLVFRHFFIHAYGFMLEEDELKPLMNIAPEVFVQFKIEIEQML